jgi:hypothetical protein
MSRKQFVVLSVVVILLAALSAPAIAPATATPRKVDLVVPIEAAQNPGPGNGPHVLLPVLQLAGGGECGGGGGCPV